MDLKQSLVALAGLLLIGILTVNLAGALIVNSADSLKLKPGEEGRMDIVLKNTFDFTVKEVSLSLDLTGLPLTTIGSSESSVDEIDEDDKETFAFILRADSSAKAGDYKVPYTISYKNASSVKKGTIGITITAQPDLIFSASTENPIVGRNGKVVLKIINKGLGEARFVNLRINPSGLNLLSEDQAYIGSIDSDDFETLTSNVLFKSKSAVISGLVEYSDLDNKKYTKSFALSLTVYSEEEALESGLISKNNTIIYVLIFLVLIVVWLIYRAIRKRRKARLSMQSEKFSG